MSSTRPPRRLFLLDGTALAYRAHFAMARSGLTDPQGRPTGATFAFLNSLVKLLDDEKPDHVAVAFDPEGPTFRHEQFEAYKATREKMPDELVEQLPRMRDCVRALGMRILEVPGFEADDALGTMAKAAEEAGYEVFLVTGDKDFMQLVSEQVKLYDILKAGKELQIVGPPEVAEKFGVPPSQVIEVLALMGDSSDNVPGVKGIGEKTAQKLVQEYGSVEAVLEAAPTLKGKLATTLADPEQVAMARLSRELVTIHTDVPLGVTPQDLERGPTDSATLVEICRSMEFNTLLKRFSATAAEAGAAWKLVRDEASFRELLARLQTEEGFTFDTETTGLDPHRARLVGFSFSLRPEEAFYVPLNDDPPVLPGGTKAILAALRPLLADPKIPKRGQNLKYDAIVCARAELPVEGIAFDTMIASYCLEPEGRSHGIDQLALRYLDYQKIETTELIGKGKDQITMDLVPIEEVGRYACEDADIAERLHLLFEPKLAEEGVAELFETIEMPLLPVLLRMELTGIRIDGELLEGLGASMHKEASQLTTEIYDLAGRSFNLNSPKQLGPLLFEELCIQETTGRKRLKKTKTGEYSTDARTLEEFGDVPIVAKLLEYRMLTKLKSTYVDTLPQLVHPVTGRIHTSFNQAVAATGRLSSSDPNLQNIPIRSAKGREIRKAFLPEAGWKLLSADYSQVELRLVAHLAHDERLIEAFRAGADIHRQTAALVFGIEPDAVDAGLRSRAKAINFGILYGMGPQRLSQDTGISVPEAKQFIDAYFETFPGMRKWLDDTLAEARATGAVSTLFGRRRRIPDITSSRPGLRVQAENMAVNTPVQGSAADVIKKAMIAVDERLRSSGLRARMLLQVHDELVLEAPDEELEEVRELVRNAMEGVAELAVPLQVDIGIGENWLEAH